MPAARSPDEAASSSGGPPRKKMRQGTHSCIECRRRKIKCIFQDDRPNVCNECFGRGIHCVDQESAADVQTAETRQSLRERVAQLESMVRAITQKVDLEDDSSRRSASSEPSKEKEAIADLVAATTENIEHAPLMKLFNNDFISGQLEQDNPEPDPATIRKKAFTGRSGSNAAEERIRQRLLAVSCMPRDIDTAFAATSQWHKVWGTMLPELKLENRESFATWVKNAIASGPLLTLCKALICLSLAVQQLPATFVEARLDLPKSGEDLILHFATTIEDNVLSNDRLCANVDALECIILLTKLDAHGGRPRKAWLAYRRALSFSFLLGLHRKSSWAKTAADPLGGVRRKNIFMSLFTGDRFMSLTLGLPYAISDHQCDIDHILEGDDPEVFALFNARNLIYVSKLAGRLIDRSQDPSLATLDSTLREDQELEELARTLPPLRDPIRAGDGKGGNEAFDRYYYRSLNHFGHHSIRSVLHLPFFLKSGQDRRYEFNRLAALESAREMIHAYRVLRASAAGGYCLCKTVDFQVFTACVMLLLNRFGFSRLPGAARDRVAEQQDEALILEVRALFEQAGAAQGRPHGDSSVQDQGAKLLGMFMDCDEGSCTGEAVKVVVPYFGTITVRPGRDSEHFKTGGAGVPSTGPAIPHRGSSVPTPPSFSASSASTPSSGPQHQPWQMPTPPAGASSLGSGSQSGASPASSWSNPFIAFDPLNVALTGGVDGNAPPMLPGADQGYFDPLLQTGGGAGAADPQDWMGGANSWPNIAAGAGFDFELDNNWNWITNDGAQLAGITGK